MSRIGRKPIAIPKEVKVEVKEGQVFVDGPKGKLNRVLPGRTNVEIKDGVANVTRQGNIASDKALQGLIRALLLNMIIGVTDGYVKELEIVGVGFKAAVSGNNLKMDLILRGREPEIYQKGYPIVNSLLREKSEILGVRFSKKEGGDNYFFANGYFKYIRKEMKVK